MIETDYKQKVTSFVRSAANCVTFSRWFWHGFSDFKDLEVGPVDAVAPVNTDGQLQMNRDSLSLLTCK